MNKKLNHIEKIIKSLILEQIFDHEALNACGWLKKNELNHSKSFYLHIKSTVVNDE